MMEKKEIIESGNVNLRKEMELIKQIMRAIIEKNNDKKNLLLKEYNILFNETNDLIKKYLDFSNTNEHIRGYFGVVVRYSKMFLDIYDDQLGIKEKKDHLIDKMDFFLEYNWNIEFFKIITWYFENHDDLIEGIDNFLDEIIYSSKILVRRNYIMGKDDYLIFNSDEEKIFEDKDFFFKYDEKVRHTIFKSILSIVRNATYSLLIPKIKFEKENYLLFKIVFAALFTLFSRYGIEDVGDYFIQSEIADTTRRLLEDVNKIINNNELHFEDFLLKDLIGDKEKQKILIDNTKKIKDLIDEAKKLSLEYQEVKQK